MKFLILLSVFLSCFLVQAQPSPGEQLVLNAELLSAVKNGNVEGVKRAIKNGADPFARDTYKATLLHYAENFRIFEILVEAGLNVSARDKHGTTPLHSIRNPEVIRGLIERGADPDARDNFGDTPLHDTYTAVKTRVLLESGADPNIEDESGNTPFQQAQRDHDAERMRLLLKHGLKHGYGLELEISEGPPPNAVNKEASPTSAVKEAPPKSEEVQKQETSCKYIAKSSKVKAVQCGFVNICMSEVSCIFEIGQKEKLWMTRNFPVVCSSLSDGKCPKADDCVLDRSIVELAETQKSWHWIRQRQWEKTRKRQRFRHGGSRTVQ